MINIFIYKTSLTLWKDIFRFKVEKYECKETTKTFILLDNKRINKEKIDVILDDVFINSIKTLTFICWIIDKDKIKDTKIKLIERMKSDLDSYVSQINEMIKMSNTEPVNDFRDYTKEIEKVNPSEYKF